MLINITSYDFRIMYLIITFHKLLMQELKENPIFKQVLVHQTSFGLENIIIVYINTLETHQIVYLIQTVDLLSDNVHVIKMQGQTQGFKVDYLP